MNCRLPIVSSSLHPCGGGRGVVLLAFLLLVLNVFPGATAATFTAALDRTTISIGESATLTLAIQDGAPGDVPAAPNVANLSINYIGQASQYNFLNGRSSTMLSYNFLVRATQPGEYTIPVISMVVDGKTLATQPLKLKVVKNSEAVPETDAGNKNAFLKLVASQNGIYLGEVLPLEIQLYWRQASPKQAPQLTQDGFTVGKMVQQPKQITTVNGQYYNFVTFKTFVVPAKTGKLALGPATMPVAVAAPNARVNVFGNIIDTLDATLNSEVLTINALPLPTNDVPPDFNGAVGKYSLNATVSTNTVTVGEPITLTIQIGGHGQIDSLTLSSLDHWRDFKIYPPVTKVETGDQFGLDGMKTFEQVVIPENAEIKQLPPITFSFFDPEQKSYRTVSHPATPIIVRPSSAAPAQPTVVVSTAQEQSGPKPATDIVHIKPRLGIIDQIRPALIQQTWFMALQAVPLFAWLMALVWRKRADRLANNPRLRRQREVARTIREGLADLRRLAAAKCSEEFFATVFRLLQEQLGERLDLPASAITESVIEDQLRRRGTPADILKPLEELFQICNQARYAPQRSSQELASLVPKVESILHQLQRLNLDER